MAELNSIFATAKKCAQLAAEMCRTFRPAEVAGTRKPDKTWVTEADQTIEKELRRIILKDFPTHAILGEEEGGELSRDPEGYTWILDPIDGTFSFVHGIPFYSSLLAVLKGNTPVIGFAMLPGLEIEICAQKGKGVWINGKPYAKSPLVGNSNIEIVATADPYRFRMEGKEKALQGLYQGDLKCRTYPDALGYYLLLQGSVRAFVDPKVEIWDVAPFHVILPEAGFAIHPWTGDPKLARGTSVAYALDALGKPVHCLDVLRTLDET